MGLIHSEKLHMEYQDCISGYLISSLESVYSARERLPRLLTALRCLALHTGCLVSLIVGNLLLILGSIACFAAPIVLDHGG